MILFFFLFRFFFFVFLFRREYNLKSDHTIIRSCHFVFINIFFFYRVRVQCAANYYNTTCTTFCRPRNDQFGHYTCGDRGTKVCISGWQGANCDRGELRVLVKKKTIFFMVKLSVMSVYV